MLKKRFVPAKNRGMVFRLGKFSKKIHKSENRFWFALYFCKLKKFGIVRDTKTHLPAFPALAEF